MFTGTITDVQIVNRCERLQVDNMGVSGECVVPTMAARLSKLLSNKSCKKYDWIIILGGMPMYVHV